MKQEAPLTSRRNFIRAMEGASLIPLVYTGLSNWDKHRTWHEVNLDGASLPKEQLPNINKINGLAAAQYEFQSALDSLNSAYRSEYHKSRLVPTTTIVNGKIRTSLRTQYYWDVPSHLPNQNIIEGWKDNAVAYNKSFAYMSNTPLVDVHSIHRIAIEAKEGSQSKQQILTSLIYGSIAIKTLFYEELMEKFQSFRNDTSYESEMRDISSPQQTKRRDWLKIGAAIAGTMVASAITRKTDKGLSEGKARLEGKINQADASSNKASPAAAISSYFGKSMETLLTEVEQQSQTISSAAAIGVRQSKVGSAFQTFLDKAENFKKALKNVLYDATTLEVSESTPNAFQSLGYLSSCASVTRQLENASNSESRRAAWAIALEGLGVAGVMALVIAPGEMLIRKNED